MFEEGQGQVAGAAAEVEGYGFWALQNGAEGAGCAAPHPAVEAYGKDVVGAVVGLAMLAIRRQSRATPIAFGPFLAAAGWLVLMFGHGLVGRYLALFASLP